jgi:uncharacterized phiE125 gp8 family phage protein
MWYPAVDTDGVSAEPVSLAEAKKQVHAEYHTDDDAHLERLISAARDHVERYTGTRIAERTVTVKCDGFGDFEWFPETPVQSVAITYVDPDGAEQTLADTVYELRADGLNASIVLKYGQNWPAIRLGSRITVTAAVGYETAPPAIKQAVLVFIADAFEQRENVKSDGRTAFDDLLSNFRR